MLEVFTVTVAVATKIALTFRHVTESHEMKEMQGVFIFKQNVTSSSPQK